MRLRLEAACGCNIGRIRKNNEDNFYFDGKCLERINRGLKKPAAMETVVKNGLCVAVFDGMGGEHFGEYASYAAARELRQTERSLSDYWIPARTYLARLIDRMNDAVRSVQEEMLTDRMGSTMAALYFWGQYVYVCNLGDSRAYRLRDGEFLQISVDHVEKHPGKERAKAPLTQYLGLDTSEMLLEPHIAKGTMKKGDVYLLCSDGLTDMLSNFRIADILIRCPSAEQCVEELIGAALEQGGRDNITAMVLKIR